MTDGPYEAELAEVLFNLIVERAERDGIELESGYASAAREGRTWCVGVSLGIIANLGWKFSVTIDTDTHSVPANVNLAAVLADALAERKARLAS